MIAGLRSTLADERARTDATLAALMADQAVLHDRLNRLDARQSVSRSIEFTGAGMRVVLCKRCLAHTWDTPVQG